MKDQIEKLLEDGEILLGITESPIVYCLIKRDHTVTPFIIKGYCPRRNEFFEKFFGCTSQEAAVDHLKQIFQISVMLLAN